MKPRYGNAFDQKMFGQITPTEPDIARRARELVMSFATDDDDAATLMDALGLA